MSAAVSAAGPENAVEYIRSLREIMFPEDKLDRAAYVKKAKAFFERVRGISVKIKPLGG